MKDRIIKFIESEKLSAAEFADHIGVQRSSVSHVLNGRNNPSFSFIQKILESYPRLNSRWLMTGEGEIYDKEGNVIRKTKTEEPKLFSTQVLNTVADSKIELLDKPVATPAENEHLNASSVEMKSKEIANIKKVSRVLIFYDDQTFEDFRPAK